MISDNIKMDLSTLKDNYLVCSVKLTYSSQCMLLKRKLSFVKKKEVRSRAINAKIRNRNRTVYIDLGLG